MRAAIFGHEETADLLLLAGADAHLKDELGLTAEQWAVRRGFPNIAQLIKGASPRQAPARTNATAQIQSEADQQTEIARQSPALETEGGLDQNDAEQKTNRDGPKMALGAAATAMLRARAAAAQVDPQTEVGPQDSAIPESNEPVSQALSSTEEVQATTTTETPPPEIAEPQANPEVVFEEASRPVEEETTLATKPEPERVDEETLPTQPISHPAISTATAQTPAPPVIALPPIASPPRATALPSPTPVSADKPFVPVVKPLPEPRHYEAREIAQPKDVAVPAFNSLPSPISGRPIIWLLVLVTLGGSIFLAYRLTNYFSRRATPSPASPVVERKSEPTVVTAKRILPVVGGALAGAELHVPDPEYPENTAAKSGDEAVSGTVTVRVQVNRKGQVVSAHALDGDQHLQAAAVKAARSAAFSPEKLAGKKRVVTGTITYTLGAPSTGSLAARDSSAPTQTNSPTTTASTSEKGSAKSGSGGDSPVTGGPLAGAERNLPKPDYPERLKSKGIAGTITVVVRVNRAGKVISWRTLDGDDQLRAIALKAVKRSTFSPDKLPGKGEVVGTITYNFK